MTKNCPSRSKSQEPYIIWWSFLVHMCKVIISQGVFFIFSKFWFSGLLQEWKCKKWPKMTKDSVCCVPHLRNYTSYNCHLWYTYVKDNISKYFFHFFKISIFLVVRDVRLQKLVQNNKNLSAALHISGTVHHMIAIYCTHK